MTSDLQNETNGVPRILILSLGGVPLPRVIEGAPWQYTYTRQSALRLPQNHDNVHQR